MVAILDPDAVPAVRLTVDEYLEADLPEGYHYELVDGVVQMSPNPSLPHEQAVDRLAELLYAYRASHPGIIGMISFNSTVPISDLVRVREPDIALFRSRLVSSGERAAAVWKKHPPFLVIEVVSPDQAERDYTDKREDYWRTRIEEYWIVDLEQERFTVLTRGETSWAERQYRPGESLPSVSLPEFSLDVSSILRP